MTIAYVVTTLACLYLFAAIIFFLSSIMNASGVDMDCPQFGRGVAMLVLAALLFIIASVVSYTSVIGI